MSRGPAVLLVTYSTKPRGGVVHTLALAEALHVQGRDVRVLALGEVGAGMYRHVQAPVTIAAAPAPGATLEERVEQNTQALADALVDIGGSYPVLHAQDCIAARAVTRARRAGLDGVSVRTVHHVDDFTSQVLMDCQRQAILEPDVVLTVSEYWRQRLQAEYGVAPHLVRNGIDVARFAGVPAALRESLRGRFPAHRPLVLSVGGIEPRKGSIHLVRALGLLSARGGRTPVLAVLGGHSFQDHRAYRQAVLDELPRLGLELGRDVVELGTVPDVEVPGWYAAADLLAFPSTKEGFGLAVLEAMSAGTPVVTSDLPVFLEYLRPGEDALMVPVGRHEELADALDVALHDDDVRERLRTNGFGVARRFTWEACATEHARLYEHIAAVRDRE